MYRSWRAQLAAVPLPGWLWDDVLEPLLAMAEGAAGGPADERLEEAIRRLREVTRQPDPAAAVVCGVRAAEAMEPLMELTEAGAYEELADWVVPVDPLDVDGQAAALEQALCLPREERRVRLEGIRARVREHDLDAWLATQLAAIDRATMRR